MSTENQKAYYIRREATYNQLIESEIRFEGQVTCKNATQDDQPITLGQAKQLIQEAIDKLNNP